MSINCDINKEAIKNFISDNTEALYEIFREGGSNIPSSLIASLHSIPNVLDNEYLQNIEEGIIETISFRDMLSEDPYGLEITVGSIKSIYDTIIKQIRQIDKINSSISLGTLDTILDSHFNNRPVIKAKIIRGFNSFIVDVLEDMSIKEISFSQALLNVTNSKLSKLIINYENIENIKDLEEYAQISVQWAAQMSEEGNEEKISILTYLTYLDEFITNKNTGGRNPIDLTKIIKIKEDLIGSKTFPEDKYNFIAGQLQSYSAFDATEDSDGVENYIGEFIKLKLSSITIGTGQALTPQAVLSAVDTMKEAYPQNFEKGFLEQYNLQNNYEYVVSILNRASTDLKLETHVREIAKNLLDILHTYGVEEDGNSAILNGTTLSYLSLELLNTLYLSGKQNFLELNEDGTYSLLTDYSNDTRISSIISAQGDLVRSLKYNKSLRDVLSSLPIKINIESFNTSTGEVLLKVIDENLENGKTVFYGKITIDNNLKFTELFNSIFSSDSKEDIINTLTPYKLTEDKKGLGDKVIAYGATKNNLFEIGLGTLITLQLEESSEEASQNPYMTFLANKRRAFKENKKLLKNTVLSNGKLTYSLASTVALRNVSRALSVIHGDTFKLTVKNKQGSDIAISRQANVATKIKPILQERFITSPSFFVSNIFRLNTELLHKPVFINTVTWGEETKHFKDLTEAEIFETEKKMFFANLYSEDNPYAVIYPQTSADKTTFVGYELNLENFPLIVNANYPNVKSYLNYVVGRSETNPTLDKQVIDSLRNTLMRQMSSYYIELSKVLFGKEGLNIETIEDFLQATKEYLASNKKNPKGINNIVKDLSYNSKGEPNYPLIAKMLFAYSYKDYTENPSTENGKTLEYYYNLIFSDLIIENEDGSMNVLESVRNIVTKTAMDGIIIPLNGVTEMFADKTAYSEEEKDAMKAVVLRKNISEENYQTGLRVLRGKFSKLSTDRTKRSVNQTTSVMPESERLDGRGTIKNKKVALLSDPTGYMSTWFGVEASMDGSDGALFSSYFDKLFSDMSLQSSKKGESHAKDFYQLYNQENSLPMQIKTAAFFLDNNKMRNSSITGKLSYERLFRLAHSLPLKQSTVNTIVEKINDLLEENPIASYNNSTGEFTLIDHIYTEETQNIYDLWSKLGKQFSLKVNTEDGDVNNAKLKEKVSKYYILDTTFDNYSLEIIFNAVLQGDTSEDVSAREDFRNSFIQLLPFVSAVKEGATSINSVDEDTTELNYADYIATLGGVQGNFNHELEDARQNFSTQVISSAAQTPHTTDLAEIMYRDIATVLENSFLKTFGSTDVIDPENIADLFLETYKDSNILTGAFYTKALNAGKLKEIIKDRKVIPISSPTISNNFFATLMSKINREMIKLKSAGIGLVQQPSFDNHNVYTVWNPDSNKYEPLSRLEFEALKSKFFRENQTTDLRRFTLHLIENQPELRTESLHLGESYIRYLVQEGTVAKGEVEAVILNNYEQYKNFIQSTNNPPQGYSYVVKKAPFGDNLRGRRGYILFEEQRVHPQFPEVTQTISRNVSLFNTPIVRDQYTLNELLNRIKKNPADLTVLVQEYSDKFFTEEFINLLPLIKSEDSIKKIVIPKRNFIMNNFMNSLHKGDPIDVFEDDFTTTYKIQGYKTVQEKAEVVIANVHAKEFDIALDAPINKIKNDTNYFIKGIQNRLSKTMDKLDTVLFTDGVYKPYIVATDTKGENFIAYSTQVETDLFKINDKCKVVMLGDNKPYYQYNDIVLGEVNDIDVFMDNGLIVVSLKQGGDDRVEKLNKLLQNTLALNNLNYLYYDSNTINSTKNKEEDYFTSIKPNKILTSDINIASFVEKYNLGKKLHKSFLETLTVTLARIPAQSLQSFMECDVVGYTGDNTNTCYVNVSLSILQGSDYDIDKDYLVTKLLDKDGSLFVWSPFFTTNKDFRDYTLKLPLPNKHKKFSGTVKSGVFKLDTLLNFIKENLEFDGTNFNVLNKALDDKYIEVNGNQVDVGSIVSEAISFILNTENIISNSEENIKLAESIFNKHHSFYNGNTSKISNAAINRIAYILETISGDIRNSSSSLEPISMDGVNGVIKEKGLKNSMDAFTEYSSEVASKITSANLLGKENIAIVAVGIKALLSSIYYYNSTNNSTKGINLRIPIITKDSQKVKTFAYNTISSTKQNREELAQALENVSQIISNSQDISFINQQIDNFLTKNSFTNETVLILSELLSLSTDNAKELGLDKINAFPKNTSMYLYGLFLGVDLDTMIDFMTSPIMKIFTKYLYGNIYNLQDGYREASIYNNFLSFTKRLAIEGDIYREELINLIGAEQLHNFLPSKETNARSNILDILKGAEAYSWLGRMLGINQGYKSKPTDNIKNIEFFRTLYESTVDKDEEITKLDFFEFFNNRDYRTKVIETYGKYTTGINHYDIIANSPHIFSMFKELSVVNRFFQNTLRYGVIDAIVESMHNENMSRALKTNKSVSTVSNKSMQSIERFSTDYMVNLFLKAQGSSLFPTMTFKVPEGKYFEMFNTTDNNKKVIVNSKSQEIPLDIDNAKNFKKWVEDVFINILKENYPDNEFVKRLTLSEENAKGFSNVRTVMSLGINMADVDFSNNPEVLDLVGKFREIRKVSINKIISTENGGFETLSNQDLTVEDIIRLYTLIVHKNTSSRASFQKFFEELDFQVDKSGESQDLIFNSFIGTIDYLLYNPNESISPEVEELIHKLSDGKGLEAIKLNAVELFNNSIYANKYKLKNSETGLTLAKEYFMEGEKVVNLVSFNDMAYEDVLNYEVIPIGLKETSYKSKYSENYASGIVMDLSAVVYDDTNSKLNDSIQEVSGTLIYEGTNRTLVNKDPKYKELDKFFLAAGVELNVGNIFNFKSNFGSDYLKDTNTINKLSSVYFKGMFREGFFPGSATDPVYIDVGSKSHPIYKLNLYKVLGHKYNSKEDINTFKLLALGIKTDRLTDFIYEGVLEVDESGKLKTNLSGSDSLHVDLKNSTILEFYKNDDFNTIKILKIEDGGIKEDSFRFNKSNTKYLKDLKIFNVEGFDELVSFDELPKQLQPAALEALGRFGSAIQISNAKYYDFISILTEELNSEGIILGTPC